MGTGESPDPEPSGNIDKPLEASSGGRRQAASICIAGVRLLRSPAVGIRNSSLTRVRPFFNILLERDATGADWLSKILSITPNRQGFRDPALLSSPGTLQPVELDEETKLDPPEPFLRWLIQHPKRMTWPKKGKAQFGPLAQHWREKLMGTRDLSTEPPERRSAIRASDRQAAIQEALSQLDIHGARGSFKQWWAFEGRTSVDCYLSTDRLRICVEGKRTDILSPSTDWYPRRNQLLRNLEAARSDANGAPFACIVIAEKPLPALPENMVADGLPHLAEAEREDLLRHFLGSITWRDATQVTGVDYHKLPDRI